MPVTDAHKRNLRLPRELAGRLKKEASAQGISENAYLIIAITQKLDADEGRRKQQAGDAPKRRRDRDAPRGLGLRLESLSASEPLPANEPAAPVVVNVGAAGGVSASNDGLIAGLVAHIAAGRPWERQRRHDQALEILRSASCAPAARKEAEQRLEEALAGRTTEQRAPARLGSIGSLFRQ